MAASAHVSKITYLLEVLSQKLLTRSTGSSSSLAILSAANLHPLYECSSASELQQHGFKRDVELCLETDIAKLAACYMGMLMLQVRITDQSVPTSLNQYYLTSAARIDPLHVTIC